MKRIPRKNATELSVFIVKDDNGNYDIVDPSMDGESIPLQLFTEILEGLGEGLKKYNENK